MLSTIRILFIGDIVGKIGRRTVASLLPALREEHKPDAVIANAENIAHGKGVTEKALAEMKAAGVDAFTGGNHVWSKSDPTDAELQKNYPLALPANDPRAPASLRLLQLPVAETTLYVLNLLGRFEMHDESSADPFTTFNELRTTLGGKTLLFVDFHAEATSEKVAFGFHVNGRASAVLGTHTHIPTADERILTGGTGYITDVGMTGSNDSVLGVAKEVIIARFLTESKETFIYPETGPAWLNGVILDLDKNTGNCVRLERVQKTLIIK